MTTPGARWVDRPLAHVRVHPSGTEFRKPSELVADGTGSLTCDFTGAVLGFHALSERSADYAI